MTLNYRWKDIKNPPLNWTLESAEQKRTPVEHLVLRRILGILGTVDF